MKEGEKEKKKKKVSSRFSFSLHPPLRRKKKKGVLLSPSFSSLPSPVTEGGEKRKRGTLPFFLSFTRP